MIGGTSKFVIVNSCNELSKTLLGEKSQLQCIVLSVLEKPMSLQGLRFHVHLDLRKYVNPMIWLDTIPTRLFACVSAKIYICKGV